MNDLMERLIEVWAGLGKAERFDDATDQRRRLRACLQTTGGHFEYSP